MRGFVRQSIHWSVGPSVRSTTRQPDKKQSQEIPKPHTYDFFPTARTAFIGKDANNANNEEWISDEAEWNIKKKNKQDGEISS